MTQLEGRVVAITGGARGIGLATAKELTSRGAVVHIGDLDPMLARREAAEAGLAGARKLDVTDRASFKLFLGAVEKDAGPIDALVNNAGVMPWGRFLEQDDATIEQTLAVNLDGVVIGMRLALPPMVERGHGHIVNVASLAGRFYVPGSAVYSGAKAAVISITDAVRRELEGSGVEVSAVLPTMVATELASGAPEGRGLSAISPEDVARTIAATLEGGSRTTVAGGRMGPVLDAVSRVYGLLPRVAADAIRSALGDRRAIDELDGEAREAYERRLAGARSTRSV